MTNNSSNIHKIIEDFHKLAQLPNLNQNTLSPQQQLKNLLKHIPYAYRGFNGTIAGTTNLHSNSETALNANSGLMRHILDLAKVVNITGAMIIDMNVDNMNRVLLTGNNSNLLNGIKPIFIPILEQQINSLQHGRDHDFTPIKMPPGGIKINWITYNVPASPVPTTTSTTPTT